MQGNELIALSKVRFTQAKECLSDAKMLAGCNSYKSAANRAYYAVFHAMRAVLALDGIDKKHHSGIISEFRVRYLKTEVLNRELSNAITVLSDARTNSDYNDFYVVVKSDVIKHIELADGFLQAINDYLATQY